MGKNASTIKCYLLPIWFSENAIQVFGESDERLTMKITSYFMPKSWHLEPNAQQLYDVKSYYYVTIKGDDGKE
jgi:hypothetical protein